MKKMILCVAISLVVLSSASGQVEEPRISVNWAMLLNIVPGFGVGSFMQGDTGFAIVQMLWEAVWWGSYIYLKTWGEGGTDIFHGFQLLMAIMAPYAFCAGYTAYMIGLVRPSVYDSKYRAKHRSDEVSIGIGPSITPSADRQGFHVGMELVLRYMLD